MKNILYIINILTGQFIFAQTVTLPLRAIIEDETEGAYYKDIDNELNQFAGTWIYTNGNEKYSLDFKKLIKEEFQWGPHYYKDLLVGGYKIVTSNQTIHNSIATQYNYIETNLRGLFFKQNQNKYRLTFEDPLNCDITGSVTLEIDPNNRNKMIWHMTRDEMYYNREKCPELKYIDPETSTFGQTMSLPYEMILTKVMTERERQP